MAQKMNNGIKRFASSNPLQVRNSQMMMLPSGVYSASSRDHSRGMVSLLRLVLYLRNCSKNFPKWKTKRWKWWQAIRQVLPTCWWWCSLVGCCRMFYSEIKPSRWFHRWQWLCVHSCLLGSETCTQQASKKCHQGLWWKSCQGIACFVHTVIHRFVHTVM